MSASPHVKALIRSGSSVLAHFIFENVFLSSLIPPADVVHAIVHNGAI